MFGITQTRHLTGYRVASPVLAYPHYANGVMIARAVAPSNVVPWPLQSRQQTDLPGWLEGELRAAN